MTIFAVVVTYNRISLLPKVLDSIRKQTRRIDKIIVVNNNSTDGTFDWLKTQNDLLIINQDNLGGAGGFHTGIKYAFEHGADWIWTMDDDVFPEECALEELIKYKDLSDCIIPTRYYNDGVRCNWGGIYDLKRRVLVLGTRPRDYGYSKPFYIVNTSCFEGMLISRKIVELIGYPDIRFFISGDDTIYGLLASRYTNIFLVEAAILKRAKSSGENQFHSPFYLYYLFRNFHLFEEYYCKLTGSPRYSVYTRLKIYYEAFKIFQKVWNAKEIKYKALKAILSGIRDSYRKKTGRTFKV